MVDHKFAKKTHAKKGRKSFISIGFLFVGEPRKNHRIDFPLNPGGLIGILIILMI